MASDNSTVARPYAQAAFEFALEQNNLATWVNFLQAASLVCLDKQVQPLLIDPRVSVADLYKLFHDVCQQWMDDKTNNFLQLLVNSKRLSVLPEISLLFESYRAEQEKTLDAEVVSFMPLTAEQQQQLTTSLQNRLQRDIALHCHVDEKILGGFIVRAGDYVLDASVARQLQKMYHQMVA